MTLRDTTRLPLVISGAGGGKASAPPPHEDENDLRSKAVARFIELLGEGENGGLVDGAKSIFLDSTPLQNADGSYNFDGIEWQERTGTVDQPPISGFSDSENETPVAVEVRKDLGAIVRTVTNSQLDSLRVRIQTPALFRVVNDGKHKGDILRHSVKFSIEYRPSGGIWTNPFGGEITLKGKTNAGYEADYRFQLNGEAPWDVRVTRVSDDEDQSHLNSRIFWAGYTEIIEEQFTYPYCHILGIKVDTALFGTSIPSRTYHVKGRIVEVPVNFDPVSRTYSGIWDGTFKLAWTDDPAWCYRDMLRHDRYGLGKRVKRHHIDDGTLYVISQRCNELVPDGYGGQEPRFTLNLGIMRQEQAYRVINDIASVFWGMTYWSSGSVSVRQDAPRSPEMLVTNANVLGGKFSRSGTSLSARANAVIVAYNDPGDLFRQKIEQARDDWSIINYGYRPKFVTAFGCASRGQAKRLANWLLLTEQRQTETITYRAADDHQWAMPGDVIEVMDTSEVAGSWGGRVKAYSGTSVTLDKAPEDKGSGLPDQFYYMDDAGQLQRVAISFQDGDVLTLSSALPAGLPPGFIWVADRSDVSRTEYFQIVTNKEVEGEPGVREITALTYIHEKFADIDDGGELEVLDPPVLPTGAILPPASLSCLFSELRTPGSASGGVAELSWSQVTDARLSHYEVEIDRNSSGDFTHAGTTERPNFIYSPLGVDDTLQYRVRAVTSQGLRSAWATSSVFTFDGDTEAPPVPDNWTGVAGFDQITLTGNPSPAPDFKAFRIYASTAASAALDFLDEINGTTFVRRPPLGDPYTRYKVTAIDHSGNESDPTPYIDVKPIIDPQPVTPSAPTGLSVSSVLSDDGRAIATATWQPVEAPAITYEVETVIGGGNPLVMAAAETSSEWSMQRDQQVVVRVRTRNIYGQISAWSAPASHTAAKDTAPPAVPQGLAATAGFNTIWLEWGKVPDADLSHYEVYPKASGTVPGTNPTGVLYEAASASFVHSGLPDAYQRYYFVRAVDTSGNKSGWSAVATATTSDPALTGVTTSDIQGAVDSTSFASGLVPIEIVDVLPTTGNFEGRQAYLTANGKRYRFHSGAWTKAIEAPDITGEITSAQIKNLDAGKLAGQLTDAQISAVNASKIAGTISNSQIGSLSATKIINKLTKDQINTITTGQLEGTIGADLLAANIITSRHMAIGDFTNLNTDRDFSDPDQWMFTGTDNAISFPAADPVQYGGSRYMRLQGNGTNFVWGWGPVFEVDTAGCELHVTAHGLNADQVGNVVVHISVSNDPAFPGNTATAIWGVGSSIVFTTNALTEKSAVYRIPAGYAYARVRYYITGPGTTDAHVSGIAVRRMNEGRLLVDGAIAANHLAVDSVTASAVAAGEIGANHLAANSILAKHLVVGDLTNAAAGSSGMWDKHPWIMHNVGSDTVGYANGHDSAGENAFWMYGSTTKTRATLGTAIPVIPGEQFHVSMWVYVQSTFNGDGNSKLRFGDQDNAIVAALSYHNVAHSGWRFLETSFTVPAGVRELFATIDNTATSGYVVVDDIVIRRKAGGELIVDGAIKADHILAGEIGTDHLAANSITSAKLAIGDFTNMIPDSAAPDAASWDNHSDVSFVSDTAADTPGSIKYDPSDGNRYAHPDKMFPVTPGEQYYVRALARVTAGDAVELRFVPRFYDRDGGQISTPVHTKLVTSATYTQIDASFTVPAGTHEMLMDFGRTGGSGTGPAHVSSPYLQRRNTGELIVDGAIKGTHLDVVSASAAILTAGAIKAGMLDAGVVTAKNLAVGDFDNLNRDMHYAEESLWQGAAGFYDTAVPDWGGKRVMRITGAGTDFNVVYGPAFTVSPEGEELWIRARMQRWAGTNNGENDIIVPVQVSDDETFNSGVVDVFPSPVVGTNSAEITSEESVITIPPGYRFCRLRPYKRNTGATEVRVGGIEVRRRNAGQLIVDGGIKANHVSTNEIITNSANIKDAVITDAKIADLDAAKLTAGSALAGSITVDGRAVASLANTDVLFDDMSVLWQHFNGSGTLGFTTTGVTTGQKNQYVSDDGVGWIEGNEKIPYDPSKLYRVTFRVRRGAGTGGGTCYLGLVGYKADKSTRVNIHGDDTAASSHYIVAKAKEQNDMPSVLTEYVGYIKGHASSGTSSDSSTIDQPCVAHEDVRYFSPIGVFNFTLSSGGYEMHIDSVKIEAIAEENVAALVNTGSTKIEPGKIVISGDTTLDDWRAVGKTTIDGGNIEADSITAASLSIGLRGVVFEGITFEADPDTDTLTWSAGRIRYRDNDNTFANVATSAGSVPWTGGVQFVWWEQGATDLTTGKNTGPLATSDGTVLLALYRGGTDLSTNIGRTVIDGDFIRTGSIEAQHIKSGELTTELLEVNGYLDMDADNTGVRIGKQSVVDSTDGAYFGRTDIAGSSGFGFYIGRTSGGTEQRIRMTEQDGLEIKNADFLLGSSTASRTTYTTSTTYTIPAGTDKIDFAFVGGGGGGQGGGVEGGVGSPGYNGGDTVVTLKDGANTIATWTAAGGQGGPGPESRTTAYSPYGNGGEGGKGAQGNSDTSPGRDGADGDGGSVATVAGFDVSGLSNPKLEINIGSGGTGGGNGDDGNAGFAEVTVYGTGTFPAGPVARQQAAAGVVSLTSGQNVLFPALGSPGFWQCWGAPSGTTIEIDSDGGTTRLHDGNGGFFSERNRPRVLSASSGTINYRFWPMG